MSVNIVHVQCDWKTVRSGRRYQVGNQPRPGPGLLSEYQTVPHRRVRGDHGLDFAEFDT